MAGFHTKTFSKHDDYMTPYYAWKNIEKYLPKDKVIWEAFYGNGESGSHLKRLGCKTIHYDIDFFENNLGDCVISNPPFSKSKKILERLVLLEKPFILIMPCAKLTTQYFRKLFAENENQIQLIIPRKRIHFKKMKVENGVYKNIKGWKDNCNFDCFYYCWKMNLPKDLIFLGDNECCREK